MEDYLFINCSSIQFSRFLDSINNLMHLLEKSSLVELGRETYYDEIEKDVFSSICCNSGQRGAIQC